ncbi:MULTISPECIES: enterobactin transporter EntS [Streptomyces]|uniref:Enterobactin transporter EntS n=2 Tax=Streptomyces TaxID=1883 RepID=A0ABD5ER69_9ACTN|nr:MULTISPECIES: enterobactin transporter EntS [unclassified Streptomyces]MDT0436788.1 enterobactin transporter EntS [Streptomyces sp. DSM 41981]MYQ62461.1 enterobactin transporter EntS [Streptomyces sp. SID4950]SCD38042.1 MFS transporter, ENTS family, enterobactin (siderophore) exporter [Streptomyces sp. SolWspMP-5a-2]
MRLGEVVVDVTPLRSGRDFRLVFATQAISMLGTHLTSVAASLQIYELTGSSVQVGLMSAVLGMSLLVGLVTGGLLADRVDRRRVVLVTRSVTAVVVTGLAVNAALPDPKEWFVFVAAVLAGGTSGLGGPAMMAATPTLVAPGQLAAAGALLTLTAQLGGMVGPSLAGVIAAGPGLAWCFAIDAAIYVVGLALLAPLPKMPPVAGAEGQHPLKAMAEGLRFLRTNQVVAGLLLIDVCAVVFAMPYALFPELGTEHFGGGPSTVGLLYTAPAVGSFFGALASGWTGRVHHTGRALIGAVAVWGVAITCFGLSPDLWLALAFLALAGLGDTASEILRRALLQHYTPDRLQGRVGSLWLAQATAGPSVGNLEAGLVARALGSSAGAVVLGGAVCLAGVAAVAVAVPGLRRATLHGPPAGQPDADAPAEPSKTAD